MPPIKLNSINGDDALLSIKMNKASDPMDKRAKIVEHKAVRDDLRLMMQLGVVGTKEAQYEPLFQTWKGLKG